MFTPTQTTESNLSTSATLDSRDLDYLQSVSSQVISVTRSLQEIREQRFRRGESVYDVIYDCAVDALGGTDLPERELERIEHLNNIKWNQVFTALLRGSDVQSALNKYDGGSCTCPSHIRVSTDELTRHNGSVSVPLGASEIQLIPNKPIENYTKFDELIIEGVPASNVPAEVSLNFVNTSHSRSYSEVLSRPTPDTRLVRTNISDPFGEPRDSRVLVNLLAEKYPTEVARRFALFFESELAAVRLPFEIGANPGFGSALIESLDVYATHIPQRGEVILSREPMDKSFEGSFPEKQSLAASEVNWMNSVLGYPEEVRPRFAQIELLYNLVETGAVDRSEISSFYSCEWSPRGVGSEEGVYRAISQGKKAVELYESIVGESETSVSPSVVGI